MQYTIEDWAGNQIQLQDYSLNFKTWDDAESALSETLGDDYDTDRGEYYIVTVDKE